MTDYEDSDPLYWETENWVVMKTPCTEVHTCEATDYCDEARTR